MGVPYHRITPPAEAPGARVRRGRPHPGLGLGRSPDQRGRPASPRLLGRHRPERAADHPRSRAAVGPDRHPDRRVHLRRPRPRVGGRRRGAAGRGGPPDRGARRARCWSPPSRSGRVQEMVYGLHQLHRAGRIPDIPIYVDSPLAVDTTTVFRMHPEVFDQREQLVAEARPLFDFPLVRYVRDVADSKALNQLRGPAVIIAASGHGGDRAASSTTWPTASATTATSCSSSASRPSTPSAGGSRAARGRSKILGEEYPLRAEVETIGGYSAHADRTELRAWVRRLGGPIRRAFVRARRAAGARGHGGDPAGGRRAGGDPCRSTAKRSSSSVTPAPCVRVRLLRRVLVLGFAAVIVYTVVADHGAGGEPAGPAPAGGRHRGARRRAVQRPAVAGAAAPGSITRSALYRERLAPLIVVTGRRRPRRHDQRGAVGQRYLRRPRRARGRGGRRRARAATTMRLDDGGGRLAPARGLRRVMLVSDPVPHVPPAPRGPPHRRSRPTRRPPKAAPSPTTPNLELRYLLAEGFKVPVAWVRSWKWLR